MSEPPADAIEPPADAIELPERPRRLRDRPVAAWSAPVTIPTYRPPPPDRHPQFLERRVYQGSSGRVYPRAVTDRLSDTAEPVAWEAVHLENEHLRLVVLPGIGGRIHVAQDRRTGYDLIYRQHVIKPALVGLLGPWISGGIEFNWPQHHRPTTFDPVDWAIEELPDGGAVVWCSEHEPTERMQGMHGVSLHPGSSRIDVDVRLVNRTPLTQTFLWWANVGVHVHDAYEAFFPPDVTSVVDHAKRAISTFPVATGTYYGVDYGARPAAEADLRWYRNIPVPTSYMAIGTRADFFGGYDHAAGEGILHWADHAIAPGKKLWTWGDHEFGHAWDRELTDADGPYVELMAGVFTDNQPDFSFLRPGEVRTFRQSWYPIVAIGPAVAATPEAALALAVEDRGARVGVAVTSARPGARIRLREGRRVRLDRMADLAPDRPFVETVRLPSRARLAGLELTVEHDGVTLVAYRPADVGPAAPPDPAREPPAPAAIETADELYLTGLHLWQYRHATRRPEAWLEEALRRDPGDSRANTAMAELAYRAGRFPDAERHLRAALERLTERNPNPRDSEASYLLGLVLRATGRPDEADEALGKAGWDGAFAAAAGAARAELAAAAGCWDGALEHAERVLATSPRHPAARGLRMALLRRAGRTAEARAAVAAALADDPLDVRAHHERLLLEGAAPDPARLPGDAHTALDVAHDEARAGLFAEAVDALERALAAGPVAGSEPLVRYTLAWLAERRGDRRAARRARAAARGASPDHVFPARLEDIGVLEAALAADPDDARAAAYLGHLLYDRRRYREAIGLWRRAARLEPGLATVQRNLGIAEVNVLGRPEQGLRAYRRAQRAAPDDARVLYELDQLRKRLAHPPAARLRELERHPELVGRRDDLGIEHIALLNRLGRHEAALAHLHGRRFHPWEGGEGRVAREWVVANREVARAALAAGRAADARESLDAAMRYPANLGEGKHLLTPEHELQWLAGLAARADGDEAAAGTWLEAASVSQGDPAAPPGDGPFWRAAALGALGDDGAARALLESMLADARRQARRHAVIPYFATSLPTMLLFDEDPTVRSRREARYLEGLALLGLGRRAAARRRFEAVLREAPDDLEAALRLAEAGPVRRTPGRHRNVMRPPLRSGRRTRRVASPAPSRE